jgi:hypothetical protein
VTYNVYRATDDPYFFPGAIPYATTGDTSYADHGAAVDTDCYFYLVTAADSSGNESGLSMRVGKFAMPLFAE